MQEQLPKKIISIKYLTWFFRNIYMHHPVVYITQKRSQCFSRFFKWATNTDSITLFS